MVPAVYAATVLSLMPLSKLLVSFVSVMVGFLNRLSLHQLGAVALGGVFVISSVGLFLNGKLVRKWAAAEFYQDAVRVARVSPGVKHLIGEPMIDRVRKQSRIPLSTLRDQVNLSCFRKYQWVRPQATNSTLTASSSKSRSKVRWARGSSMLKQNGLRVMET